MQKLAILTLLIIVLLAIGVVWAIRSTDVASSADQVAAYQAALERIGGRPGTGMAAISWRTHRTGSRSPYSWARLPGRRHEPPGMIPARGKPR